ncbi:MAG TPA: FAD-binding oxidoreductase, partial [Actinophytocola sp.]|uniref:FAD-binding oxidoreductase n=1 Tax=Actinophytocola sp. TaxID=1872138 RepID=UPI002E0B2F43|nr:FAD-binding oxidoreductase [Actinophytocola sp.]
MADPVSFRLTVAEVITETSEARTLVFELSAEQREHFAYRPGQFLTLRIPSERTGSVARCYSLCSCPHTESQLRVTVKRTPDGYASNWLCDNVKPGTTLEALAPAGIFTPRSLDGDLLLLAAGSGI